MAVDVISNPIVIESLPQIQIKTLIFSIQINVFYIVNSLKDLKSWGCNDTWISKSEFVTKTHLVY